MTDSAGAVVQTYSYDSFGNIVAQTGSIQQPYTYTGREHDSETGLYYYRARYYDTITGRFISKDPIGFKGGLNLYTYVGNNPVRFRDPFGLRIDNPLPQLPTFSDAYPNSTFIAPVADIVAGGIEAGGAIAVGVLAGASFIAGPETWAVTIIAGPASIEAGWDAVSRTQTGIDALGDRKKCP